MSIRELRILQKIKEYNQASQGANTSQSYTGTNKDLLERATNDPDKSTYLIAGNNYDDIKDITQQEIDEFDKKIKVNISTKSITTVINNLLNSNDLTVSERTLIQNVRNERISKLQKQIKLRDWYNNYWVVKENNAERIKSIQNIGTFSKLRFDGETDEEYISRMKQMALTQPTQAQVIENQKLKEKNTLRNNLLKIADIKQTELIMNDSRLDNPDIIHKINSIWNKILADIKENYVQIDAKVFVDFAIESMYNVSTKKEGKLDERITSENVLDFNGVLLTLEKNNIYDYDKKQKIMATEYNTNKKYDDLRKTYPNITALKDYMKEYYDNTKKPGFTKPADRKKPEKAIPEANEDDEENINGLGIKKGFKLLKSKTKTLMRGRGLHTSTKGIKQTEEDDFVDFGKFIINTDKLESNKLRVLYKKTFLNLKDLPTKTITDNFKDLLLELIEMQKFNERLFNSLDKKERDLCKYLLEKSNVRKILKIKLVDNNDEFESYKSKLELLIGEINAGNDSPLLKQDALQILKWLKQNQYITTQIYNKTVSEVQ